MISEALLGASYRIEREIERRLEPTAAKRKGGGHEANTSNTSAVNRNGETVYVHATDQVDYGHDGRLLSPDGTPGRSFVDVGKSGNDLAHIGRDAAILSIAMARVPAPRPSSTRWTRPSPRPRFNSRRDRRRAAGPAANRTGDVMNLIDFNSFPFTSDHCRLRSGQGCVHALDRATGA